MWNIKDKVIDFRGFIKQSNVDSEIVKISFEEAFKRVLTTRCVTEENVEMLRQKLLKDMEDHYWDSLEDNRDLIIKHIEFIINKRFGVE